MRIANVVGVALMVAGLVVNASASAGIRRMHTSGCETTNGPILSGLDLVNTTQIGETGATSFGGSKSYLCGVDSEPGILNHTNVTTVNVHGFDGTTSGNASANLCITNFDADSFSCGSTDSSSVSGTGEFTITLSSAAERAAWIDPFNTGDFPYIRATVSRTNIRIRGFFIETTD